MALLGAAVLMLSGCGSSSQATPSVSPGASSPPVATATTTATPTATTTATPAASTTATPTPNATATAKSTATSSQQTLLYQWTTGAKDTIFTANSDGTEGHVLMPNLPGLNQWHPDWSTDGSQIAFTVEPLGSKEIWIADADGSDARALYTGPPTMPWADHPAWSPDSSLIAAATYSDEPTFAVSNRSTLVLVDVGAGSAKEIAVLEDTYQAFAYPRWSPDGNALVASIGTFGDDGGSWTGEEIVILRRTGDGWSDPVTIVPADKFASYPDWSRTGDLIVFATRDGSWFINIVSNSGIALEGWPDAANLFTVRPDGSELIAVTNLAAGDSTVGQPSWAPDGRIVFTYNAVADDGSPHAAYMDADGSEQQVLKVLATHSRLQPAH